MAEDYVEVADVGEVQPGQSKVVEVNSRNIALFNVKGEIFALDNACSHRGGPLGDGLLDESVVTCPWHGWQYDVKTGVCLANQNIKVARYKVKVEKNKIAISVD